MFYVVFLYSMIFIVWQYHLAKKGRFLVASIISMIYSLLIFNFLQGESFMFLTVYINCYLYLMTLVAYLKKSSFS
ncbi:putative membrane protein [Kurthia sp. 11kri321]|nr:putative membrane protein [Kurthia sp. 11kri321]